MYSTLRHGGNTMQSFCGAMSGMQHSTHCLVQRASPDCRLSELSLLVVYLQRQILSTLEG